MLISRARFPVRSLGYGERAGLWTQGCGIGCAGCIAQDTWERTTDSDVPVSEILAWLACYPQVDGLTISGGEPLDQAEELVELLRGVRSMHSGLVDILCFSGRTTRAVERAFPEVLSLLDVIVTGPYDATKPSHHPLMGSANQEIVLLTDLARERYGAIETADRRKLQVHLDGDVLTLVGVPAPGVINAIEASASSAGLQLVDPTWGAGAR